MTENFKKNEDAQPAPLRILVVDDDAACLNLVRKVFASFGIEAVCVGDAMMALVEIQSAHRPIHLVLTDYRMPGMNGIEFAKKLNEQRSLYPVVIWSSYFERDTLVEIEELAKRMQIRSVEKSVRMKDLAEMIRGEVAVWRSVERSKR